MDTKNNSKYYKNLGNVIKTLRRNENMTLQELSEGICSTSYITRIEKGECCPNAVILYQISNRLNISLDYLFSMVTSPNIVDLRLLVNEITYYIGTFNYKHMNMIIEYIKTEFEIDSPYEKYVIEVFEIFSYSVITKNYEQGIIKLKEKIDLTFNDSRMIKDIKLGTLSLIGYIYILHNKPVYAYKLLSDAYKKINDTKFISFHRIVPELLIYLSLVCNELGFYEEAIRYVDEGISFCKKRGYFLLIRTLYYIKGEVLILTNEFSSGKQWFNKSLELTALLSIPNDKFPEFVKKRQEKLPQLKTHL